MVRTKHYKVIGQFIVEFSRIVSAKSEAEAIRKARDFALKQMKIKKSQFQKQNVNVFEID